MLDTAPADLTDRDSPNYFRLTNIYGIRRALVDLREYVTYPEDRPDDDKYLEALVNRAIRLAWPHRYPKAI